MKRRRRVRGAGGVVPAKPEPRGARASNRSVVPLRGTTAPGDLSHIDAKGAAHMAGGVVPVKPEPRGPRARNRSVVPLRGTTAPGDLSHIDAKGAARMVDVGDKPVVRREAVAEGFLVAAPATLDRLMRGDLPKGEALSTARIAGIAAAKKCDELIPLCHTLPLDSVNVDFERVGGGRGRVRIIATARIAGKTGVEMEALVAVSIAALTLYDMTKAIDKAMRVEGIRLLKKTRG